MGSMNWLGFSLSAQDHSQNNASHAATAEEVSGTGECFHLTAPHSPPIFEAFNSNTHDTHTQDWNYIIRLKGLEDKYKTSSESSSLYSSHCQNLDKSSQQQEPKLENFLGRDHQDNHATSASASASASASVEDYMLSSLQLPLAPADQSAETSTHGVGAATSSNIGLSMIKTWLRNQPIAITPSQDHNANNADSGVGATNTQSLSLSMTMSSLLAPNESCSSDNKQPTTTTDTQSQNPSVDQATPRKSIDTFGQRTSIYRGVTRHRWTGRYEAHLWDNSCRREGQTRKGRQVYLGGYDKEEKAARAYDLAALKYWGTTTTTNFPISNYEKELEEMKHMTRQEYVASLRRKSSGFSRGASIYRGVTRHHQHGRWQARIGRVAGNKDLYLGTFSTQEEAAEAYDIAAIKFRGLNAVTNFDMSRYDVKSILESSTLPIGGAAKRLKEQNVLEQPQTDDHHDSSRGRGYGIANVLYGHGHGWAALQSQPQPYAMHYPYGHGPHSQGLWCKQEQDSDHCSQRFQDLRQLQLAGNTQYNLFHSSSNIMMSMDSSSAANAMDNSCGSNSINVYGGKHGYGGSSRYAIPMATASSTVIGNDHDHQDQTCSSNGFGDEYQSVFCSLDDPYHAAAAAAARNLYNYSSADARTYVDQQSNTNTNWVPTAIPRSSSTNIALCSGAPPFPLLHD